jgi:hypothetical protein
LWSGLNHNLIILKDKMAFNLKNSVFFISTGKPAADNTGIISEESGTEKQPEELILQAARIQSV